MRNAPRFRHQSRKYADWSCTQDGGYLDVRKRNTFHSMNRYCKRLNQGPDMRRHIIWQFQQRICGQFDELCHSSVDIEAEEAQLATHMWISVSTRITATAGNQRIGRHSIAHRQGMRLASYINDAAREFVTDRQR